MQNLYYCRNTVVEVSLILRKRRDLEKIDRTREQNDSLFGTRNVSGMGNFVN